MTEKSLHGGGRSKCWDAVAATSEGGERQSILNCHRVCKFSCLKAKYSANYSTTPKILGNCSTSVLLIFLDKQPLVQTRDLSSVKKYILTLRGEGSNYRKCNVQTVS